jgi:predicted dehydrogenase
MKRILKTLHVGVGGRGLWPLEHCTPATGFQSVGLCDTIEQNLVTGRAKTGLPATACFGDLDAMIKTVPADALIICTPTMTHVPFASKAFAAGLAVLTEKGMAPDWSSAVKVVAAAEQAKACFCVAQNYRFRPLERTIHRAVTDATAAFHVGEVYWADYIEHRVRPEPRTLSYPFASVWDMSCHHFDNMIAWFGPVESVTGQAAKASWSAYTHPNNTAAMIRFASGLFLLYGHTHDAARAELRIRLHGKRGALFATEQGVEFNERPLQNFGVLPAQPVPIGGPVGELGVLEAFYRYITDGVEPGISGRNNLEVMALCQMLVLAIEQGRTVQRHELAAR